MCRAVSCRVWRKTTWAGCGEHVSQVKAGVAAGQWCGGEHSDAERSAAKQERGGFFSRLLGGR